MVLNIARNTFSSLFKSPTIGFYGFTLNYGEITRERMLMPCYDEIKAALSTTFKFSKVLCPISFILRCKFVHTLARRCTRIWIIKIDIRKETG